MSPLLFSRFLCIAAHNFDLLCLHIGLIIQLEVDILDEESPDFIAEAICVQMALHSSMSAIDVTSLDSPPLP